MPERKQSPAERAGQYSDNYLYRTKLVLTSQAMAEGATLTEALFISTELATSCGIVSRPGLDKDTPMSA